MNHLGEQIGSKRILGYRALLVDTGIRIVLYFTVSGNIKTGLLLT